MSSHKDDTPKPSPSKRSERSASIGEYRDTPLQKQSLSDVFVHSTEEQNLFQPALDSRPPRLSKRIPIYSDSDQEEACL